MNTPKGHHTVSRLHLQHFAGSKPAGQIWTYDAVTGREWSAIPEETSVQTHFYSAERDDGSIDTRIEEFLSTVESNAAPVYEGLLRGQIPGESQERVDFAQFIALMYTRTTAIDAWQPRLEVVARKSAAMPTRAIRERLRRLSGASKQKEASRLMLQSRKRSGRKCSIRVAIT